MVAYGIPNNNFIGLSGPSGEARNPSEVRNISYFEENVLKKLWKKEAKVSDINKKNMNLNRNGNDTAFFSRQCMRTMRM